jgi:hypothetical protein
MHPPPGPPRLPEGIRSARQVGSRLPVPPAIRWGRVASLDETIPRSTAPHGRPRCKHRSLEPSHGSPASSSTFPSRRCRHLCERRVSETESPKRLDSPGIEPRMTTRPSLSTLSVGYTSVVDGCPPATPVRQRRRNGNHSRSAARNARQCGSRSGLHRDVAAAEQIPADPAKQEARVPSERGACRSGSHVERSALRAMHLEDPEGSRRRPQPGRALAAGSAPHRRGLSAPWACCHARGGPACAPPSDGDPVSQGHGSCEPKPALSDRQLHPAAST